MSTARCLAIAALVVLFIGCGGRDFSDGSDPGAGIGFVPHSLQCRGAAQAFGDRAVDMLSARMSNGGLVVEFYALPDADGRRSMVTLTIGGAADALASCNVGGKADGTGEVSMEPLSLQHGLRGVYFNATSGKVNRLGQRSQLGSGPVAPGTTVTVTGNALVARDEAGQLRASVCYVQQHDSDQRVLLFARDVAVQ